MTSNIESEKFFGMLNGVIKIIVGLILIFFFFMFITFLGFAIGSFSASFSDVFSGKTLSIAVIAGIIGIGLYLEFKKNKK